MAMQKYQVRLSREAIEVATTMVTLDNPPTDEAELQDALLAAIEDNDDGFDGLEWQSNNSDNDSIEVEEVKTAK